MFCKSCGKEIGDAEWCPNCGAQQPKAQGGVQVVVMQNNSETEQQTGSNPPAIISLILGIASFFSSAVSSILALIPGIGPFLCALVPFFPLTGLILGVVGLAKSKTCHKGKGMAIAGLILSILNLAFSLLFTIAIIVIIAIIGTTILSAFEALVGMSY